MQAGTIVRWTLESTAADTVAGLLRITALKEVGKHSVIDCSQTLIVGQVWSVCSMCLDRSMCSDVTVSFVANMETRQKWVRLR